MNNIHLNGHHRKTLASIFTHPASHNVEWHDVLSLLNHVGHTSERHDGGYDVAVGSDAVKLGRSHGKDLTGDELRNLQAFLTKVGVSPANHPIEPAFHAAQSCIVLVDHQEAKLFLPRGEGGDHGAPVLVRPDDADGALRKLRHRQGNDDHDGGHAAEENGFYERISAQLSASHQIVLLSDGKGRSNAGEHLVGYLKHHDPAIADRVVATGRVDIAHLSDGEIVAAGLALLDAR